MSPGPAHLAGIGAKRIFPLASFAVLVTILSIAAGLAMRIRILLGLALPPARTALWLLAGTAQDAAIILTMATLLTLGARRVPRLGAAILSILAFTFALLHLVASEMIIIFGHPARAEDVQVGWQPLLLAGSIEGYLGVALLLFLITFIGGLLGARALAYRFSFQPKIGWILLLGVTLTLAGLTRGIDQIESAHHPLVTMYRLGSETGIHPAQRNSIARPRRPPEQIRILAGPRQAAQFVDPQFPLARIPVTTAAPLVELATGVRPNIVILLLESLRTEEVGAYGAPVRGLTPDIDALSRAGIRVDQVYSTGVHTPEGELAIWYGLLADPRGLVIVNYPDLRATGLPELLRGAGWKRFLWFNGSDQTFYGNGRFYGQRGFRVMDGRDFPRSETRTNWGFSDRALMRYVVNALDRSDQPFASMLLTTSNHHPFQLPSDAQRKLALPQREQYGYFQLPGSEQVVGRHTIQMLKTIHYTDEAIGYFFELAKTRSWFRNTIFIITGDHGIAVAPSGRVPTLNEVTNLQQRVPLIFYSPLLPGGLTIPGPASHIDLIPTLLGLLKIKAPHAGLGRDLLDGSTVDPDRPIVSWAAEARRLSLRTASWTYHAELERKSGSIERELLFEASDITGRHDVGPGNSAVRDRFRELANTFLEMYPWLLSQDRVGLPPMQR